MSDALIEILRWASVAVFAAPLLVLAIGRARGARVAAHRGAAARAPVVANFAAFSVFFPALVLFRADPEGLAALLMAATGCLLAAGGAVVLLRSRRELGAAWSLVPTADAATGLVTTGPYRVVRHPIYLSFFVLTAGDTLAFASWPALVVMLGAIMPSFFWRASREEDVLRQTFGERYELYRRQTRMIIPYLL